MTPTEPEIVAPVLAAHQVEAQCAKCSSLKVDTRWHFGIVLRLVDPYPCSSWDARYGAQEHLCRACRSCGHSWAARTADASEEPDGDV